MQPPPSDVNRAHAAGPARNRSGGYWRNQARAYAGRCTTLVGRPASMRWVSDALLTETIDVWSDAYGRSVSADEALEILMNVKRLGEAILEARREGDRS